MHLRPRNLRGPIAALRSVYHNQIAGNTAKLQHRTPGGSRFIGLHRVLHHSVEFNTLPSTGSNSGPV